MRLPDDRASGFNIKTHCGKETVAAVGGGKKKRKRARSSTKKQKAAKSVKDTMNAIFGDEEGVEDIFGCVVSLDNMSSISHPTGMNERLTEIFCEPSKPLKLLKDGEEKEDAIRDYLLNPSARIDDQFVTLLLDKVQDDDETHWDICKDTSVWVNGLSGDVEHFGARVKGDATHHNPVVLDPRGMGPCQNCNTMCSIIEPCHNCGNAKQDTDLWRKRSTRGKWCAPRSATNILDEAFAIEK